MCNQRKTRTLTFKNEVERIEADVHICLQPERTRPEAKEEEKSKEDDSALGKLVRQMSQIRRAVEWMLLNRSDPLRTSSYAAGGQVVVGTRRAASVNPGGGVYVGSTYPFFQGRERYAPGSSVYEYAQYANAGGLGYAGPGIYRDRGAYMPARGAFPAEYQNGYAHSASYPMGYAPYYGGYTGAEYPAYSRVVSGSSYASGIGAYGLSGNMYRLDNLQLVGQVPPVLPAGGI